ncbi:MAG TPA: VOC family protein [Candidatus Paceibacterota bacterium]|nr:VOC family protein [Candidatus Paceibacterota bacterium]
MKILAVDYIYHDVSDLSKALVFYKDVLGLKSTFEGDKFAEFDLSNVTLTIGNFAEEKPKEKKEGPSVGLAVDDVGEAIKYLKSKGVKVLQDFIDTPVCHMAMITDPDGNQITIHKRKDGTVG